MLFEQQRRIGTISFFEIDGGNGKFSLVLPCSKKTLRLGRNIWGWFLKWWYPTTIGFPAKNDHFRVFGNTHIYSLFTYSLADWSKNPRGVKRIWCFLVPNFTQLFRISKTSPSDGITAHHSNLMPVVLDITPSLPTTLIPKPCNCGKKIISFILLRNLIIICFTKGPLLTFMGTIMDQCFLLGSQPIVHLRVCQFKTHIRGPRNWAYSSYPENPDWLAWTL